MESFLYVYAGADHLVLGNHLCGLPWRKMISHFSLSWLPVALSRLEASGVSPLPHHHAHQYGPCSDHVKAHMLDSMGTASDVSR